MPDLAASLAQALAGRYDLEQEVGEGGMATVYRARDLRHDRRIAIKLLRPELAALLGPERFLNEIRVTARLQHPGILALFDSGEATAEVDGRRATLLYYVMPFVEGESLRDRLRREVRLPVEEAVRIATQVAAALEYAHQQGIVHRDIKPENILFHWGQALVADFGIALALSAAGGSRFTQTGLTIGTPTYMSPEQAFGDGDLDGRSDVYSLGCVLYEMLAGEPPHSGPTPQAVLSRRLTEPVPAIQKVRPDVPASVSRALSAALARERRDRFESSGAFEAALKGTAPAPRPRRAAPRFLPAALLVVAVAVAALLGLPRLRRAPATPLERVVAVLPFRAIGSPEDQYFADGLSDEIAVRLARIPGVRVVSRRSVERYRDSSASPREVGLALHATYVLDGTVRWDRGAAGGARIRVAPALTETARENELWSESYDAALADVFTVQSGIAERVTEALGVAVGGATRAALRRAPTTNLRAYDTYLRGNTSLARRTPDAVAEAVAQYQAAIGLDTAFVLARARLAYAYLLYLDWGWPMAGKSRKDLLEMALHASDEAVARDSSAAEAWLARAYVLTQQDPLRMTGALVAFEHAIALDTTNAEAFYQYGQTLMVLWHDSEAIAAYRRTLMLEPGERPMAYVAIAAITENADRHAEARRFADSAVALTAATPAPYALSVRGMLALRGGDLGRARRDAETALEVDSSYPIPARSVLARALVAQGDSAAAQLQVNKALAWIGTRASSSTDVRFLSPALLAVGRRREAIELVERVVPRGAYLSFYLRSNDFDPIREDPRFERVVAEADPRK